MEADKGSRCDVLQERIEELGSGILNYKDDKVYITGFYNSARLLDWLNGFDCWQSKGIYDKRELNFSRIKDNALFIVREYDIEVKRFQYVPFFKGSVQFNSADKTIKRIFTLRKCRFSGQYNIIVSDENNVKQSFVCTTLHDLEFEFMKMFPSPKLYDLNNKVIKEGFEYVKRHGIN